jgi:DNA-binding NarL/FixJ family response regulator
VRVAIADDSALFRGGLTLLLGRAGVTVNVEAGSAEELLARLPADPPDVAIIDLRMPPSFTQEGLEAAEALRVSHPRLGVLILSTYSEAGHAIQLFAKGAAGRGYMLKDRVEDVTVLRDALGRLAAGESVMDRSIVDDLIRYKRRTDVLSPLTAREQQVLQQMAEGRSNAGIAAVLQLSAKTVENYVAAIFTKLDIAAGTDDNRRVLAALSWLRARPGG